MTELLDYAMRLHIFPFSLLLVLLVLFWLSVILGAADVSLFDLDVDADVDVDANGGFFHTLANFLNLAEVPFMVVLTLFTTFTWFGLMTLEEYVNTNNYLWLGCVFIIPCSLGSLVISRYMSKPFGKFFNILNANDEKHTVAIGSKCKLLIDTDEDHGHGHIYTDNAPVEILCYTDGEQLKKGDEALILSFNEKRNKYLVTKY